MVFVVIIIRIHSPGVDFVVVIINVHSPGVDFVVIIEVDIQPGAGAEAEDVVKLAGASQIEVNHTGVAVAVEDVVNLLGVITLDIKIGLMVQENMVMVLEIAGIPGINRYHIINQQYVLSVIFGAMLPRNVNGFMMIFRV